MSNINPDPFTTRPEIEGTFGVVTSTHWIATAVGMGILMGRDRWSRWQESLMGWWTDAGGEPAEVPSEPYPPVV